MTPDGPLDLREFVQTPATSRREPASDERLGAALAARPPRYELRRIVGRRLRGRGNRATPRDLRVR